MAIEEGTQVLVKSSNSGYTGAGEIIGLAYADTYIIKTQDPERPVVSVKEIHLEITAPPEPKPEKSPFKKSFKPKDVIPEDAFEGRRDYDSSPTDGKRDKKKKGNGKRLPKRSRGFRK